MPRTGTPELSTDPSAPVSPASRPTDPPPAKTLLPVLPPLSVRILCTDVTKHLDGVYRQKGGIGRQGYDEKQQSLKAFFSGAGTDPN